MTRFFVPAEELQPEFLVLSGENATHAKVLRLKRGEEVVVCDGRGNECVCTISDISADQVCLVVQHRQQSDAEPSVQASVYMAFSKGDKFEHVVQKATELGAFEIIAFPSARCVSRPDDKSLRKKLDRWQKIAASAAQQSGRGAVPTVLALESYDEALRRACRSDLPILFYENEQSTTLKMTLGACDYRTVSLITGPEGGLEPAEVEKASVMGVKICTLGKRILRCETAPLCALSAVMYDSDEF